MTTIKVYNNEQQWYITKQLLELGYKKISDCYWFEDWVAENGARVKVEVMW